MGTREEREGAMSEPVSERAHYVTTVRGGETGLLLVQHGRSDQPGPVRIARHRPGTRRTSEGVYGRLRRRRRLLVAGVAALLGVCLVTALAWAEPGSSRCSLAWPEISRNFGPGSGWQLAAPPVPLLTEEGGLPKYQAHVLESPQESRVALIIAEWGDPQSPRLGPVVYCAVRSAEGSVVEELGRNPLKVTTVPTMCPQCT